MDRRVFLDASFWIALRDERDVNHQRARDSLKAVMNDRAIFVTTPFVFAEAQAAFSRSRARSIQIIKDYEGNPLITAERTTVDDERRAIELIRSHQDKSYSFCDALSFIVMDRLGLQRALTFDDHFRQIGRFEVDDPFAS